MYGIVRQFPGNQKACIQLLLPTSYVGRTFDTVRIPFTESAGLQTVKPCTQMQMKHERFSQLMSVPQTDVIYDE